MSNGTGAWARQSQQLYGLQFKEVKKLDVGGPVTVKALEDGDIQVGILFTGSSVIPKDAVLLKDDKGLQGADNPVVLVKQDKNTPELDATLDKVSAKITTARYRKMMLAVTNDKEDPKDVASDVPEGQQADLSPGRPTCSGPASAGPRRGASSRR